MKTLIFIFAFILSAFPYKYMDIIIDHEKVTETASSFLYQFDLSDSIDVIEDAITDETNIIVCAGDTATKYPRYINYIAGKRLLLYVSAPKSSTVDDTLQVCFGTEFSAVNTTSTFTNNNITNFWGIDRFSGNTFYDYAGSANGTGNSVDTGAGVYGVGAVYNGTSDSINFGNATMLSGKSAFTISFTFKITSTSGVQLMLLTYKDTYEKVYFAFDATLIVISVGGTSGIYASVARSGNITNDTWYFANMRFNGSGATNAEKLILCLNGVEKSLTFTTGTVNSTTGDLSTTVLTAGKGILGNSFLGRFDELSITSDAKSTGYIADRYKMLFDTTFYSIRPLRTVPEPVIDSIEPTVLYFKGDFLIATGKVAEWNGDTIAMSGETDSSFYLPVTPKGNNLPDTLKIWAETLSLTKIVRYDQKRTKLILGVK